MQALADGNIVLAATDLTDHLACGHLTQQRLAIARGQRGKPRPVDDPHAELRRTRGERHEAEQLERLSVEAGGHVDLSDHVGFNLEQIKRGAEVTEAAMRDGAPLIFQAQLFDGRWQGRADFLRRIDHPSDLGNYSYEVLDTKLARQVKPHIVHQLCLYSRLLGEFQGLEPTHAHVILGDGSTQTIELAEYAALHRHTARRLEAIAAKRAQPTYPEPVSHCDICAFAAECYQRRVGDDHLSLVAGARRDQRDDLIERGMPTVAALAAATPDHELNGFARERFELLRHQAALQVRSRETGEPCHRQLEPARAVGYAAIPPPSDGDVFFDLEGDPYIGDAGIEYLWGWWTAGGGYECIWGHDAAGEKLAFERFVDRVLELRDRHPDLHVYHYAPHERSKLRSLSIEYATREEEVDVLLRAGVLVDLLSVVRRALQVGEDSYSLKKLERHHGFIRLERSVREGGGSIVAYENWLETGDTELLESIRAYNEEDCSSTLALRNWLLERMRPEAEREFGVDFDQLREPESEGDHPPPEWLAGVEALIARLSQGLPADGSNDDPDQAERRLVSHLLLYHRREGKPSWWKYFDLEDKTMPELIDDRDAVGGLAPDPARPPAAFKRSLDYSFTFPTQETRLDTGELRDPTTGDVHKVVQIGDDRLVIRRSNRSEPPQPTALGPGSPIEVKVLREALVELAQSILAGDGRFAATLGLLRRDSPRLRSGEPGESAEELAQAALELDGSGLPIQGPPGTGKTYRGARMIATALAAGRRVGICAQSHAVIQNLLRELEQVMHEAPEFTAIYKGEGYDSPHDLVEVTDKNEAVTDGYDLVAGTAWLFAREQHRQAFDLLFVDEAGQFSLANAAAIGLATGNFVFLGDPQQLPQVTQVEHPSGSGASVLEHLLDGASTIPPGRGVLLTESWRMHPDVCEFVSERSYDGRLHSRGACSLRGIGAAPGALDGTGLRAVCVAHEGRSQASPEEARVIGELCRELLGGATVTDDDGVTAELTADEIMVVAPYNLAVRAISARVPAGVRVGTVDRFQGQQAAVVFYAMTCSSGEDAPRGLDFLFDSHRLNVAVSRAQCLAVLVHNPNLLDADCPTLESMRLADGLCRFVELAEPLPVVG